MRDHHRDFAVLRRVLPLFMAVWLAGCGGSRPDHEARSGAPLVVGLLSDPGTLMPVAATTGEQYDIINLVFLNNSF